MVHHLRIRLGLGISLTLLLGGASRATQLLPLDEAQLIERSSLIVIGQCTEVRSTWMGRRLMTLATIAVRETLKGEPHAQVTVVIPGGMDAQRPIPVAAVVAGTPQLAPAEEVVLFLSARPDEPDRYTVTGWEQGKFSVLKDAKGGQVVALGRRRPPPSGTSEQMPSWNTAGTLPLAQFRASILRRVESRSAQP
jgi:hypothetical protein